MKTELMDTNNKPIYTDAAIAVTGGTVAVAASGVVPLMASMCAVSKAVVPGTIAASYVVGSTAASGVATGFAVAAAPFVIGLGLISGIAYGVTSYNFPATEPTRTVAGEHFIVSEHYTTSEPTCPICREDFKEHDNVIRLQCNPSVGHEYHKECISVWARTSCQNRCPMCRAPFDMVTI